MNGIFITGSDTDVGKTWFGCALIRTLRKKIARVGAYKPVASGNANERESDAFRLREATGGLESIEMVCPQSFKAPVAPPLAAQWENRKLDEGFLIGGAHAWNGRCDFLVVEGAGGLLSPITFKTTNADFALQLGWPLVIVVANRLGAVNQALMTMEVALSRGLDVAAIVLNETTFPTASNNQHDHASMIRQQLLAKERFIPSIIEFSHEQTEIDEREFTDYFGSRFWNSSKR